MKDRIRGVLAELIFLYTLRVTIYTANDVYENRGGIAVAFDEEVVAVRGREKDHDYQAVITEKMELAEENKVLGKRALEQEQENETLLHRVREQEERMHEQEEEIAQLRKRLRMSNGVEVLGA
jgi:hypothetical protein